MKIVCGSCQAKYSIADEKVAGKVFKIRCKRCSEVIVVRGDQEAAQEAAAPAYDAPADAIWHVVINGEQAGPYTPSQIGEMLSAGHLDWEAYVWCEGLENWQPMRDLPDLVAAITGQEQQAQPAAAPAMYTSQPSMGADPFADDGKASDAFFEAPAASPPSHPNLFGGGAAESGGLGGSQVIASAPSPRVSIEQTMTGARNENSVLFSLKNLQALATGSSTPGGTSSPSNRPGFAGGEGSGLIDIRALASTTGLGSESKSEESEKDALLSLGSAQTGAFGTLGSPMLTPVANDDGGSKKGLIFAIVGGCTLLAVAGITAAVIMRPSEPAQTVAVAPVAPPPMAASATAMAPAERPAQPSAEPPSEGELAAKQAAEAAASSDDRRPSKSPSGTVAAKRREEKAEPSSVPSRSEPVVVAKKAEEKPKPKGASSSIDDLLDSAITGSGKPAAKAAPAPAADANLPDKPTREQVLSAMNGVKNEVLACAKGQSGVAFADVTVSGKSGRVSAADITGVTGEAGSCIARAVRKASFPKFKSDTFQVKFPYRL